MVVDFLVESIAADWLSRPKPEIQWKVAEEGDTLFGER